MPNRPPKKANNRGRVRGRALDHLLVNALTRDGKIAPHRFYDSAAAWKWHHASIDFALDEAVASGILPPQERAETRGELMQFALHPHSYATRITAPMLAEAALFELYGAGRDDQGLPLYDRDPRLERERLIIYYERFLLAYGPKMDAGAYRGELRAIAEGRELPALAPAVTNGPDTAFGRPRSLKDQLYCGGLAKTGELCNFQLTLKEEAAGDVLCRNHRSQADLLQYCAGPCDHLFNSDYLDRRNGFCDWCG